MENLINWFEIPVKNFSRAVMFYKTILGTDITEIDMYGTKMGMFPSNGRNVSGALVQGNDYKPSSDGVLAYLNGGNDLQRILDKIEARGGTILVSKTQISAEMGYFGVFMDTEGNKLALHSMN